MKNKLKQRFFRLIWVSPFLLFALVPIFITEEKASGPSEILIGNCETITGVEGANYAGTEFGIQKALEDINKNGGVFVKEYNRKIPMKVIAVDNESEPAKAGTLASDLILRDKVHALITGPAPATQINPQAIVAERNKVPYIAGFGPMEPFQHARTSAEPPWKYTWGYGFGIAGGPPPGYFHSGKKGYILVETLFAFMDQVANDTNKKAGVFASSDSDGVSWYKAFPKVLEGKGFDVVGEEKKIGLFPIGTKDHSSTIRQWKKNKCEVLWGNCPGPEMGVLWRQCHAQGYVPKIVVASRAGLYFDDISAWGGDLPQGISCEVLWSSDYPPNDFPGIGGTTPQSIFKEWENKTGKQVHLGVGWGYFLIQILADAIERAGTLNGPDINKAIGKTDMKTICGRAVFTKEQQFCYLPFALGQWMKTDKPWKWEKRIVFSMHDFLRPTAQPIFPLPGCTFK